MNKQVAIEILVALACCSVPELYCTECPLFREDDGCRAWRDEEVVEAVRFLNKEREQG